MRGGGWAASGTGEGFPGGGVKDGFGGYWDEMGGWGGLLCVI